MINFQNFLESKNIAYYHGSRKKFPVGFILTPQNDGYTSHSEVQAEEQIIEKYRPKNKLSRKNSVFMVDNIDDIDSAGGYLDFVYRVEPLGKIERSDMHYYSEISIYHDMMEDEIKQLALNYWSGIPSGTNTGLFEYRTPKAKILELVHAE